MARVLIVDDDAGIRASAAMALEKVGHRTAQAASAEDARPALRQQAFDVVVSDIYMPGENGIELLQSISERKDPPRVILMTARGTIETTALAQRIGAFDYLAKPFELKELIARVAAAVAPPRDEAEPIEMAPDSRMVGSCGRCPTMKRSTARTAPSATRVTIQTQAETCNGTSGRHGMTLRPAPGFLQGVHSDVRLSEVSSTAPPRSPRGGDHRPRVGPAGPSVLTRPARGNTPLLLISHCDA